MTLRQRPGFLSLPHPALAFGEGAKTQRGGIICPDGTMSMASPEKEIQGPFLTNFSFLPPSPLSSSLPSLLSSFFHSLSLKKNVQQISKIFMF